MKTKRILIHLMGIFTNNMNNACAFQLPFYIIINLAIGGDLPGNTIDNASLLATMYVNYVRFYKLM